MCSEMKKNLLYETGLHKYKSKLVFSPNKHVLRWTQTHKMNKRI